MFAGEYRDIEYPHNLKDSSKRVVGIEMKIDGTCMTFIIYRVIFRSNVQPYSSDYLQVYITNFHFSGFNVKKFSARRKK